MRINHEYNKSYNLYILSKRKRELKEIRIAIAIDILFKLIQTVAVLFYGYVFLWIIAGGN